MDNAKKFYNTKRSTIRILMYDTVDVLINV